MKNLCAMLLAALPCLSVGGCSRQSATSGNADYVRQIEHFDRQTTETDVQLERTSRQLDETDAQLERTKSHADRYEKLLDKWEEQAERQDKVLDALERMLQKIGPGDRQLEASRGSE